MVCWSSVMVEMTILGAVGSLQREMNGTDCGCLSLGM